MNDQNELRITQDRELVNLKDFEEQVGGLVKIFPYRALYGKKEKTLFQDGATTIVRISQNGVPNYYHLKFDWDDEKGEAINEHRYFEAYYMEDVATKTAIRPDTTAFTKDTRRVRTIKVITDTYIQSNDYKIDFYTIGEPFDREKAQKGEQIIYYGTDFTFEVPALAEKKIRSDFDIDISTPLTSFVLQDITMQEEQFGDAKLVFWDKDIPLDDVESMTLEVTPDIILDRVLVKGITEQNGLRELTDIDFTTSTKEAQTIPFMVTPISTEQKVEIDTPWFYNRKTLDLFHMRDVMASTGQQNGTSFKNLAKRWGMDQALIEVILDMVLLTYEYQINFSNIELESNGAPKPEITMGYGNWKPGPLMTSGALHGVSAVWKKWEKTHASSSTRIDSNQYKMGQAFIAAFSKNIISEFSVAGGGNDFNKNILPWRLILGKPLEISVDDKTSHYRLSDFFVTVDKNNPFFGLKRENGEQIWNIKYLKTTKTKITKTKNKWFVALPHEHNYDEATNKGEHDFSNGPLDIYIGGQ